MKTYQLPAGIRLVSGLERNHGFLMSQATSTRAFGTLRILEAGPPVVPSREISVRRSDTKSTTIIFGALDICRRATLLCAFMPGANMSMILMLLGAAILIGSAMIS